MLANYDYYRVFHMVAACGNITAASQALFLSQSTVSRTIQNLEAALGCQLLLRSTHGIKLTSEGELLYHHLGFAVEHIQTAEEKLENIRQLKEGVLHIGVSESTLDHFLLPYLEEMKSRYQGISIRLAFTTPEEAVEKLNANLLDLAVLATPLPEDSGVCITPIRKTRDVGFRLLSGRAFMELRDEPQDLTVLLEKYPFICFKRGTSVRAYADEMAARVGKRLEPACEVDSTFILRPMVRAGLGLGFVQTLHPDEPMDEGDLFQVQLKQEMPRGRLCLLTSNSARSNAANRFIELLLKGRQHGQETNLVGAGVRGPGE